MIWLNDEDVRQHADTGELIAVIRSHFARDYSVTLPMPMRTSLELGQGTVLLLMPCYDSALGAAGVKTVTVSRKTGVNATYGRLDPKTGSVVSWMEARHLTCARIGN